MNAADRPVGMPPFRNHLLAALAPGDLGPLQPYLQDGPVRLAQGQVLYERGRPVANAFFPESGLVSLTADTLDSGAVEVGVTGREGVVGASILLTPQALAVHNAIVQIPGEAWCVPASALREAFDALLGLRDRLLRYVQFLMVQSAHSSACDARHDVSERLARWLLCAHDRVDGDELALRQESVSLMLGVRRSGVSIAAGVLQARGLIRQSRGRITVIDRAGLEAAACGCYRIIRESEKDLHRRVREMPVDSPSHIRFAADELFRAVDPSHGRSLPRA